ncbi:MAG: hypothetical protein ACRYGI_03015 [Janthinobacterium lividum]
MSGILGSLAGGAELLIGSPAPLIIGDLLLQGHEVPGRISIGGAQAVTIHKLPGGGRIIDAMGADQGVVAWHGLFIGPDAARRARTLDIMRQQGAPRILSFGDYTFNVVIVHYEYDYKDRGAVISYRIRCEIVPDPAGNGTGANDLAFALQGDFSIGLDVLQIGIASALSFATLGSRSGGARLAAAAGTLGTVAASLGVTAQGANTTVAGAASAYGLAQTGLEMSGLAIQTVISSTAIGSAASTNTPLSFASASELAATTGEAAVLATAVRSGGHVNRINANLAMANAAATGTQVCEPLVHA